MGRLNNVAFRFICLSIILPSLCLLASLSCIQVSFAAANETVRVGIFENKPMCYTDAEGRPAGIFVAVIQYVALQEGWQLTWIHDSFNNLRTQLQDGKIDILLSTAVSKERRKLYAYNEVDVFNNWAEIYIAPGSGINSLLSLQNKRVATLAGGIYSTGPDGIYHLDKEFHLSCDFLAVDSYREALEAVAAGDADVAVVNRLVGAVYSEEYGVVKSGIVFAPVAVRFALDKRNLATVSRITAIDIHLNALIADSNSTYHQVISKALGGVSPQSVIPRKVWWMIALGSLALLGLIVVALMLRWQIKRKTARLIEANSFTKQAFECVREGIIVYDLEGRFQGWNPYMEELSGVMADKVIGKHSIEVFPFLEGTEVLERLHEVLRGEILPSLDFPYEVSEAGKKGWASVLYSPLKDSQGNLIGVIGIIREITEQRQAATTIRENEELLRNLLESTSTVPWELDLESSDFTYMGQQVEDLLGYPADSWKDMKTWSERVHSQDRDGAVEFCTIETQKGKDHDFVYRAIHQDGSTRWIRDIVSVVKEQGKVVRLVGFLHDITDEKLLAMERDDLESRLQQAQKMEAIGTLAGGIAHDFNNILGAVLGYAELAQEATEKGSVISGDLDKVIESGNRAKDLVKQILAFSRQGSAERIVLQPVLLIREVLKMLRPSLPSTIEIRQRMSSETGLIYADPTQIHQIVMNLCTNAFHAMEKAGGRLEIAVKDVELGSDDLVHEPDVSPGKFVQISVADTGPGIDATVIQRVFDPYFTTKEMGKGTGMGLAIVHGIVKSYGGFVSLHCEPAEGTVFHVHLPVVKQDERIAVAEENGTPVGCERILFVDDEQLLAEMGRDMLERLGYHVTMRTSSLGALETFQNQPGEFDLIVTDQTMPGMTGVDLARRMMQIRPDIPVILCTGYSAIITEEQAKSMGIREFVFKPVAQKDLACLVRKVLDGSVRMG